MALALFFAPDLPPLAAIAAAAVGGVTIDPVSSLPEGSKPQLALESGDRLLGLNTLVRFFGRLSSLHGFYGVDPVTASQVDEWLDYSPKFSAGAEFEECCHYANSYLAMRTFLVGYTTTVADITIWSSLAGGGKRWESMKKSAKFPHLSRWYDAISVDRPILQELASKYVGKRGLGRPVSVEAKPVGAAAAGAPKKGKADVQQTEKAQKVEGSFEISLPGAEMGKVCTRFPPEPSGFLHIGHAKAAFLNEYFARKYGGKLIVRFDDTNPSKEKDEFVTNIMQDLETLEIKPDEVTYTSDYFPALMEMAEKLIKEGKAYVDDTPREVMQKERMDGIESKRRNQNVEENLALWKEMVAGTKRGLSCCLRGKLDMQALNKTLRDPVYYRCNPEEHHRVGSKYKVYPTYDFACPYVDSTEGVTHALRSSEYHDRNEQYYRILADMGVRPVHTWDFSRLNFVYTLLSKRKLQWFVSQGLVEGWDDPRFPTVQGMRRRGLTVEALRRFILSQGASKNLNLMEWDKLWTINKQIIDPVCPRHTAVLKDGKVPLTLRDGPETPFIRIIPRHKKFAGAGKKATVFANTILIDKADAEAIHEGEEIDREGDKVTGLSGVLHLEGSVKTTKLKLTWLADHPELVDLNLVELDYLIRKEKMEEEDELLNVLNPVTKIEVAAVGDSNMRNLAKGEIIQLERKGYFICDAPYVRSTSPIVLISIPDGRQRPRQ
ncbi:hypothetical protein SELMODRAFT_446550 [Selaginella moellendorffii]|uniref:glutamate--tRNA ligase n=1 Tax=Selaginella moellendorffii TaxID=88036 RepID=D8SSC5_SELML|nr:hypothetical protein SELMODRAFT_446550 [Selaginella moellendorffii]